MAHTNPVYLVGDGREELARGVHNAVDATQVRPLLSASAQCATLITSRRVLATLDTAMHLRLEELSEREAVTLLDQLTGAGRVAAKPHGQPSKSRA